MCRRERKTALHFAESSTGAAESFVSNVVFPGYYWSGPCKSRRVAHRGVTIYRAESIAHRTINPERTMSVQPNHVEEVEKSWAKVAALGVENVGVLLFKNIFTVAPEALELFSFKNEPDLYDSPKLKAHGANVVSTVGKAVAGLRELEALVPVLAALGERHVGYGILEPHYDVVGKALLMTLEQGLGDAFTPEVKEAWTLVYGVVATTMKGDHYKK